MLHQTDMQNVVVLRERGYSPTKARQVAVQRRQAAHLCKERFCSFHFFGTSYTFEMFEVALRAAEAVGTHPVGVRCIELQTGNVSCVVVEDALTPACLADAYCLAECAVLLAYTLASCA